MAKVRNNQERFLGMTIMGYHYDGHDHLHDLIEEDVVWSSTGDGAAELDADDDFEHGDGEDHSPTPSWLRADRPPQGGLSVAFEDPPPSPPRILHQFRGPSPRRARQRSARHAALSAPVSVPRWPEMIPTEQLSRSPVVGTADDEWLPPHEYLARASGSGGGGTVGASMLEGVGRTLKGRDMSRVRDAVWRKTGFFG